MEVRARIPVSGGSITLYDDFAHHPTAIRATVDGLRRQLDVQGRQSERILDYEIGRASCRERV